jgi:mannose-6-phosphate isomerase-like protein (cupin superfamily)
MGLLGHTNGAYSFVEIVSAPGDGTPLHVHQNEDEHLIVLEGVARVALGDHVFDVEAGSLATFPKNVPHAWGNRSTAQLRIAVIAYPGGVEEVLRAIARDKDVDVPALVSVRPDHYRNALSSLLRDATLTLGSFFELDLLKK